MGLFDGIRNLFDKELVEIYKDLKNNRSII